MRAGALNTPVVFEQADTGQGVGGDVQPAWTTYLREHANVEATAGSEGLRGVQVGSDVLYKITVRESSMSAGITPKMRVVWFDYRRIQHIAYIGSVLKVNNDEYTIQATEHFD